MVELAIKMDIDGDKNVMQTENAYFDATHSWFMALRVLGCGCIIPPCDAYYA